MCASWNLRSVNLYERSASALRRTRPTASLHPLSHLSILATSYLTVSASSVPVEAMFNLGLILNLKRSSLHWRDTAPTLLRLFATNFKYFPVNRTVYCMGTKRFCCYQRYASGSNLKNFVKCIYENVTRELQIVSYTFRKPFVTLS